MHDSWSRTPKNGLLFTKPAESPAGAIDSHVYRTRGSREVCTFCGDSPAPSFRAAGVTVQRDTVLTAKLCDDCRRIRKAQFDEEYSPV